MVQLVFVHGVAVRDGDDYAKGVKARDQLFKQYAFAGSPIEITNIYWGKHASKPAWNHQSLPSSGDKVASFALMGGSAAPAAGLAAQQAKAVAELASTDFRAAVDALFLMVVNKADTENRELNAQELQDFAAAGTYAESNPRPEWVKPGMTDAAFLAELRKHLPKQAQSFGLTDYLASAAKTVFDRGRNLVSTGLTSAFRDDLNPLVARFLGDVFVYLKSGGQRKAIQKDITDGLLKVWANKPAGEKVIIIGHSLGGVILVDMLSDPASAIKDIDVDLLMTVGSQPGFFEEMKLLAASRPDIGLGQPTAKAPRPPRVKLWWNVYDPVDLLSFRCAPIFEDVEDFSFNSATGLFSAHTTYFKRTNFHERLNRRAKPAGF